MLREHSDCLIYRHQLPREFRLLLLCISYLPEPGKHRLAAEWLRQGIKEDKLLSLAIHHGVASQCAEFLRSHWSVAESKRIFSPHLRKLQLRSMLATRQIKEIHSALHQRHVTFALLKSLSRMHSQQNPTSMLRPVTDIDIIISPAQIRPALDALLKLDYAIQSDSPSALELAAIERNQNFWYGNNALTLSRRPAELAIDLHWRFMSKSDAWLFDERPDIQSPITPSDFHAISPKQNARFMRAHGLKDLFFKLKWLADLKQLPDGDKHDRLWRLSERVQKIWLGKQTDFNDYEFNSYLEMMLRHYETNSFYPQRPELGFSFNLHQAILGKTIGLELAKGFIALHPLDYKCISLPASLKWLYFPTRLLRVLGNQLLSSNR